MTIAAPRPTEGPADRARPAVAWTSIQAGLWVGNASGEFAGMIERGSSGEYFITDHRARPLGSCTTLGEAKARHQRQRQLAAPKPQPQPKI
ncbi:hypothetical protein [Rhodoglobus aureus]|uniref:Uncharacterized protein n=1 Tax=Rhodoglobus aureus TaxID=191497 RepID=A0ABN1VPM1_9MICO